MTWAVRIECDRRVGTGAVVSPELVLTCWHVVAEAAVAHIRTPTGELLPFEVADRDRKLDVALLKGSEARTLPGESVLVPRELWRGRRPPNGRALVELWTAEADTPRSLEVELRPSAPTARRVEFVVPVIREGVQHGHSGGPVVEVDVTLLVPRLLGIVRARDASSVDALDHAGKGWLVPVERIAERFEPIAALVESPVEREPAWQRHWEPRSRGVATASDRGSFFTGRVKECSLVRRHLDAGGGLLVVTGARGRGKSAVLARIVVSSSARYRTLLRDKGVPDGDLPPASAVDAAVLARGKMPGMVAAELSRQFGLGDCTPEELIAALCPQRVVSRIVVDAVDESADPGTLMRELLAPLAEGNVRLVIGGLARYVYPYAPENTVWLDLDRDDYGADAITPYVSRRLRAQGPYGEAAALKVARAVARRANGNFLVAELIARILALRDPIDTDAVGWREGLPHDVTDAFRDYFVRFGDERARLLALLHPLAYARGDGLTLEPPDVWLATANGLRPREQEPFDVADLRDVSRQAGDYLIIGFNGGARQLYHEGLAGAIRSAAARERLALAGRPLSPDAIEREEQVASSRFLGGLLGMLPQDADAASDAYAVLDRYLLSQLPAHLAEHGRAGELLDRPGLLLTADQEAIRSALVLGWQTIPAEREPARVAVIHALSTARRDRPERAAALCAALRRQGERLLAARVHRALASESAERGTARGVATPRDPAKARLPYELLYGPPLPEVLAAVHSDQILGSALAVADYEGHPLLISRAGEELRSWRLDGTPGPFVVPDAHAHRLAVVEYDGNSLVISAGGDGALRSWRLDGTPGPLARPAAHTGSIEALAVAEYMGDPLVISAGEDSALRSWRLDGSPGPFARPDAHTGSIEALAVADHDGSPMLVSAGRDGLLRSWRLDGTPGTCNRVRAHKGSGPPRLRRISALAVVEHDRRPLLISAGRGLRSWRMDGTPGPLALPDAHQGWINALAATEHDGAPLLISASGDGALRSWRMDGTPGPLGVPDAHTAPIRALAVVEDQRAPVVISAGRDSALRFWRLDRTVGPLIRPDPHSEAIRALAVADNDGRPLLISAGRGLRSWRLDGTAGPLGLLDACEGSIRALEVAEYDGRPLLIGADRDGALNSWHVDGTSGPLARREAHAGSVNALAVVEYEGIPLLISAGDDGALRSWRLDGNAGPLERREAHAGSVNALAVVEYEGVPLLISAGGDGALRSWRLDGNVGPLERPRAHDPEAGISALAAANYESQPLLISSAGKELRSWRLDGRPGPLAVSGDYSISALAVAEHRGRPLLISGGGDGALRSWWLNGQPGPLARPAAHEGFRHWFISVVHGISALAVAEYEGRPRVISAGGDGAILAHEITVVDAKTAVERHAPATG